jgi:peroxiredoxin
MKGESSIMDRKKRRFWVRTAILAVLASAIIYTLYANFTKEDREILNAGDKSTDFVLTDMKGQEHRLSEYKGKGVFLNFWGTWCKPCEKEMPFMNELYKKYEKKGVEILAVNVGESKYLVNQFVNKYDLKFPILDDHGKEVQNAYGIDPLPATYLIDPNGKITKVITGTMTKKDIQHNLDSIMPE